MSSSSLDPNLGVALVLSLLMLIIFVPKDGFSSIPADHLTCAFDAEEGDTGQIIVPSKTKQFPQYPDLNFMEQYEVEQGTVLRILVLFKVNYV